MPVHRAERLLRASAVLVACFAVASCATMSESECLYADWYAIGLEDGARGRHVSHVGKRRKACADAGVMPDMARYEEGRAIGLEQYCTMRNGLAIGKSGRGYGNVCPVHLASDFMDGYQLGREIHSLTVQMNKRRADMAKLEYDLESDEISEGEKERIHAHLRTLEREFTRLEFQRSELEHQALALVSH